MRKISEIASEIKMDWKKVNFAARPYLDAMLSIDTIQDKYYFDDARSIITYFLCNASSWRGEKARQIKAELKGMLK